MNVQAYCACGWTKTLSEFYAGKLVRCPYCATVIDVARPHTAYAVDSHYAPHAAPADPSVSAGSPGIPYGYPPYKSWTRDAAPQPPIPRPWTPPVNRACASYSRQWCMPLQQPRPACHSTFSNMMMAVVTIYMMVGLSVVHPVVSGLAGVLGGLLMLRGSGGSLSRRTIGAFLLAISIGVIVVGSDRPWVYPPRQSPSNSGRQAVPSTQQRGRESVYQRPANIYPTPEELRRQTDELRRRIEDRVQPVPPRKWLRELPEYRGLPDEDHHTAPVPTEPRRDAPKKAHGEEDEESF